MNKKDLSKIGKVLSERPSLLITATNENGEAVFNINAKTNDECKDIATAIGAYANMIGPNSNSLVNIIINAAGMILNDRPLLKNEFLKNIQK